MQRDRVVRCWGDGASGQLGGGGRDGRLATPGSEATAVSPGTVAAVATGDVHSCALLTSGAVRCWGQNGAGQLGSGTRDNRLDGSVDAYTGTDDASTVDLGGPATAITAGGEFTCALMASGAVRCWGRRRGRRAGVGAHRRPARRASRWSERCREHRAARRAGDRDQRRHAARLRPDGRGAVRCWGNGANGRLGTGSGDPGNGALASDDRLDGAVNATTGTDAASTVPLDGVATAISAGAATPVRS